MSAIPIRIGISSCLLGIPVRYDGDHKHAESLVDDLGRHVELVPIYPEVEAGLGVPREPMQLVQSRSVTRLMTVATRKDRTRLLVQFSARRVRELKALHLAGHVFKARSPSCGVENVPLYDGDGRIRLKGTGLFAHAFRKVFPHVPIVQEDQLGNTAARKQFLARVADYHQQFVVKKPATHRKCEAQKD